MFSSHSYTEEQLEYCTNLKKEENSLKDIVNICGIPHTIVKCEDNLGLEANFGYIDFCKAEIRINKNITPELQVETLCHEIIHGILFHIGRQDLMEDETLVQAIGNAVNQSFMIKKINADYKEPYSMYGLTTDGAKNEQK